VPLTVEAVENIYSQRRSIHEQCLKALCESHERLRAELEGMEVLLREAESRASPAKSRRGGEA
jgi:hypothetical protein